MHRRRRLGGPYIPPSSEETVSYRRNQRYIYRKCFLSHVKTFAFETTMIHRTLSTETAARMIKITDTIFGSA